MRDEVVLQGRVYQDRKPLEGLPTATRRKIENGVRVAITCAICIITMNYYSWSAALTYISPTLAPTVTVMYLGHWLENITKIVYSTVIGSIIGSLIGLATHRPAVVIALLMITLTAMNKCSAWDRLCKVLGGLALIVAALFPILSKWAYPLNELISMMILMIIMPALMSGVGLMLAPYPALAFVLAQTKIAKICRKFSAALFALTRSFCSSDHVDLLNTEVEFLLNEIEQLTDELEPLLRYSGLECSFLGSRDDLTQSGGQLVKFARKLLEEMRWMQVALQELNVNKTQATFVKHLELSLKDICDEVDMMFGILAAHFMTMSVMPPWLSHLLSDRKGPHHSHKSNTHAALSTDASSSNHSNSSTHTLDNVLHWLRWASWGDDANTQTDADREWRNEVHIHRARAATRARANSNLAFAAAQAASSLGFSLRLPTEDRLELGDDDIQHGRSSPRKSPRDVPAMLVEMRNLNHYTQLTDHDEQTNNKGSPPRSPPRSARSSPKAPQTPAVAQDQAQVQMQALVQRQPQSQPTMQEKAPQPQRSFSGLSVATHDDESEALTDFDASKGRLEQIMDLMIIHFQESRKHFWTRTRNVVLSEHVAAPDSVHRMSSRDSMGSSVTRRVSSSNKGKSQQPVDRDSLSKDEEEVDLSRFSYFSSDDDDDNAEHVTQILVQENSKLAVENFGPRSAFLSRIITIKSVIAGMRVILQKKHKHHHKHAQQAHATPQPDAQTPPVQRDSLSNADGNHNKLTWYDRYFDVFHHRPLLCVYVWNSCVFAFKYVIEVPAEISELSKAVWFLLEHPKEPQTHVAPVLISNTVEQANKSVAGPHADIETGSAQPLTTATQTSSPEGTPMTATATTGKPKKEPLTVEAYRHQRRLHLKKLKPYIQPIKIAAAITMTSVFVIFPQIGSNSKLFTSNALWATVVIALVRQDSTASSFLQSYQRIEGNEICSACESGICAFSYLAIRLLYMCRHSNRSGVCVCGVQFLELREGAEPMRHPTRGSHSDRLDGRVCILAGGPATRLRCLCCRTDPSRVAVG
jgi:hypothetical protein